MGEIWIIEVDNGDIVGSWRISSDGRGGKESGLRDMNEGVMVCVSGCKIGAWTERKLLGTGKTG